MSLIKRLLAKLFRFFQRQAEPLPFVPLESCAPAPKEPAKPAYSPNPGYVWNPLKKHRNVPCPCQSGRKAKNCCGQFAALPADVAAKVIAALEYEGYRDR